MLNISMLFGTIFGTLKVNCQFLFLYMLFLLFLSARTHLYTAHDMIVDKHGEELNGGKGRVELRTPPTKKHFHYSA